MTHLAANLFTASARDCMKELENIAWAVYLVLVVVLVSAIVREAVRKMK